MTQPSFYAVLWHVPPDLSTREVRSFSSRADRDAFVRDVPRGGTEFRLAVSGSEAQMTRRSVSRRVLPSLHTTAGASVDPSHPSPEL